MVKKEGVPVRGSIVRIDDYAKIDYCTGEKYISRVGENFIYILRGEIMLYQKVQSQKNPKIRGKNVW